VLDGAREFTPDLLPEHLRSQPLRSPALAGQFQTHAARGMGVAGIAVNIADGNYGAAATAAAIEAAQSAAGRGLARKGLSRLLGSVFETVAESGAKLVGKRLPVIGAAVTAGFVALEAGRFAIKGEFGKAAAATVTGAAEAAGNLVGFGVGDLARESARGLIVATAGSTYEDIEKSGLRQLAEGGYRAARKVAATVELKPVSDPVADGAIKTSTNLQASFRDALVSSVTGQLALQPVPSHTPALRRG
jgi:hypothetical protein